MNKAARSFAAGIAVAALALTGCAGSPADAATVNGVRISDATVREAARTLAELSGAEPSLALKQATYDMVLGEAARQIADASGTTISAAAQQEVMAQYPAVAAVQQTEGGKPWAEAATRAFLLQEDIGTDKFVEEVGELDITVNPRYGAWDAQRATLTDPSLSRIADPSAQRR
ncbi:MAG TPA: hypothetical protein GXZ45_10920 [Propionibacterium sp.]|nr:hypothetical protein [Propionibacterium sp.]